MLGYTIENIPLYEVPGVCDVIFASMRTVMQFHRMPTGDVIGQHVLTSVGNLWGSQMLTRMGTRHNMGAVAAVRNDDGSITLGPVMQAVAHIRDSAAAAIETIG